jgi:hypothetical protein
MANLSDLKQALKGGPGSGHHGHGGRPGRIGGSSPGTGGGMVDFVSMSKLEATGATVNRLSNAKQDRSVTGKLQNRIVVDAGGDFSKTYSELRDMGWSLTWENKVGTKQWIPEGKSMGYNRMLVSQENNPSSGYVNINVK